MLKKDNRVYKTRELQQIYRLGKATHTLYIVIKFYAGPKVKIGFVVSAKVSKKAVQRNRVKRVLREELHLNLDKIRTGQYMIIAKPLASQLNNSELRQQIRQALEKGKLWRKL